MDTIVTFLACLEYGDLSKYGIYEPKKGPFYLKEVKGKSPILDVGTIGKIKEGTIKVIPSYIVRIENKNMVFGKGTKKEFDAIVFAMRYRSVANNWLKDYYYVLNDNWMPKNAYPNLWKGERGLYSASLARIGLFGVKMDAEAIAEDINQNLK